MRKKMLYVFCICVFGLLAAGVGRADSIFTLTADGCTGGCGAAPYGTIDLHQSNGNVIVTETLAPNYVFINTGAGNALEFNVSGATESDISSISAGFSDATLSHGSTSYTASTFGSFLESVTCSGCGRGMSSPLTGPLTFTVDNVMIANFIANSGGYYFASDIGNLLTGATGNVASNGGISIVPVTPVIPEPPSLLLLGTGLLVLAGAFKAKLLLA